jgi:hypothetical protein
MAGGRVCLEKLIAHRHCFRGFINLAGNSYRVAVAKLRKKSS